MAKNETYIHPTAIIHSKAKLDSGVFVGPYSIIGENVVVHSNTRIDSHVTIMGHTEIGEACRFYPFSSIGSEPQDTTYKGEETVVKIGKRNVFREFMTVHRSSTKESWQTLIGDDNYFMAYSHIAHDCHIGNETTFINGTTLGGHVAIDDFATLGGMSGIHPFCRVGKHAYLGGTTVITQDVLPFCRVAGSRPPLLYGLNTIGLKRKGYSRERIRNLKDMFKIFFYSDLNTSQAVERIKQEFSASEDRDEIISFVDSSKRGIVKKAADKWENDSA